MKYQLDDDFLELLKKLKKENVRLHSAFWSALESFEKGELPGKQLIRELKDYKRIVFYNDKYAALYKEIKEGKETIAKFFDEVVNQIYIDVMKKKKLLQKDKNLLDWLKKGGRGSKKRFTCSY